MDKFSADKLDNLFKEQFSDEEFSLEGDYWPGIEKGLDKMSFYRFGWKHVNIYNISLGVLALLIPLLYVTNKEEEKIEKNLQIVADSLPKAAPEETVQKTELKSPNTPEQTISSKKNKVDKNTPVNKVDSVKTPVLQPDLPVALPTPEPAPVVEEEKPKKKPKQIIYVVQQDTIIQKDTVKVRRKKK